MAVNYPNNLPLPNLAVKLEPKQPIVIRGGRTGIPFVKPSNTKIAEYNSSIVCDSEEEYLALQTWYDGVFRTGEFVIFQGITALENKPVQFISELVVDKLSSNHIMVSFKAVVYG